MKVLRSRIKRKISLDEISNLYKIYDYIDLVEFVIKNIKEENIRPIKNSGTNGKNPALYNSYMLIAPVVDYSEYKDELQYRLNPRLNIDYYLRNLKQYKKDRDYILDLNRYLNKSNHLLEDMVSPNERSFEIWRREKFLQKEGGIRILKNLGIELDMLNIYETTEPLSYYSHSKDTPQNVLILENKDTFYSMRRHLINGNRDILGMSIGTLIYGKGKGISKSFKDFTYCVEPYLSDKDNSIFYFGDLDFEGIVIYESLCDVFEEETSITPYINAYRAMLDKANIESLPLMKAGQNKNISEKFLDRFIEEDRARINQILSENKYIPQEILSVRDF